ncbi:MAG: SPFH domain-containing protein, partial [Clostridia bacterium]|nr:SPFH domain-containing protein [Clostridia bacterium]
INSLSIPEDQRKKITEWEENMMSTNAAIANARLVGAQADAARIAAGNEAGAAVGFMGMGMAMNAGGGAQAAQNLFNMQQMQMQQQQQVQQTAPAAPAANGWKCACGALNTGKFCAECGSPKPADEGWTCACGAVNKGKFCPECGAKKPAGVPQYKCDKCGWEPEKGVTPPKFCPECGDPFDNGDII